MSRRGLVAAVVLATAAAALGITLWLALPVRHLDGEGPLSSENGRVTMAFPAGATGPWSIGLILCRTDTGDAAVIESVAPTRSHGSGGSFVGAVIRTFVREGHNTMITSMQGYPPPGVPDHLEPAIGARVTTTCDTFYDSPDAPITELLVGFDVQGSIGGGWEDIDIGYRVGSERYTLQVTETIVRCGDGLDPTICGSPPPDAAAP